MHENDQIKQLDVDTPMGVVHLAGFRKDSSSKASNHREVIFKILSQYVGSEITAADLTQKDSNSRPEFLGLDFDVNWTHSGDLCVVAYGERGSRSKGTSLGLSIGVDLERHNPKHLRVANRFYTAEELNRLLQLGLPQASSQVLPQGHAATKEFFRLWCRKEALYKCVGGTFFAGAVGQSVMPNPLTTTAGEDVHFVDLDGTLLGEIKPGENVPSSLCVAVSRRSV